MSWHLSHRWADLPGRRGRLIASPEGGGLGRSGGTWRVLHEVWVLLAGMWVYSTVGGVSCSMHNPWPVHPGPRAVADLRTCAVGVHRRPAMREHLGVHPADMGGSAVDVPCGRLWNSAALTLLAVALRRSCPRMDTFRLPGGPARASEAMTPKVSEMRGHGMARPGADRMVADCPSMGLDAPGKTNGAPHRDGAGPRC